jgi:16S rRNA (uracil1498-N3)-methyltransferase
LRRVVFARPLVPGTAIDLTREQRHYLVNVLRMQEGEQFIGLDQEGKAFVLCLDTNGKGTVLFPRAEAGNEPDFAVSLYVPLLKGDKLDWVVQKSVELGVSSICLYAAQRAVVKEGNLEKKIARWEKIAREATEQCRRQKVPPVRGIYTLEEVAAAGPGLFAWEEEANRGLQGWLQAHPKQNLLLLTGPEGGLAVREANLLKDAGWSAVSLGPRILRAETAAIAMLTSVMFAWGAMG